MVIRHENMVFKDRRTEEHGDCLRGVRQENMRTWGLLEGIRQENMRTWGLLARIRQENMRTWGLFARGKTEEHGDCLRG